MLASDLGNLPTRADHPSAVIRFVSPKSGLSLAGLQVFRSSLDGVRGVPLREEGTSTHAPRYMKTGRSMAGSLRRFRADRKLSDSEEKSVLRDGTGMRWACRFGARLH